MGNVSMHICFSVTKDCINPNSYGVICVGCGCCSKDKSIRYPARLKLYQEGLEKGLSFNNWIKGAIRLQKRNIKLNKTYCKRRVAIYQRLVGLLGNNEVDIELREEAQDEH